MRDQLEAMTKAGIVGGYVLGEISQRAVTGFDMDGVLCEDAGYNPLLRRGVPTAIQNAAAMFSQLTRKQAPHLYLLSKTDVIVTGRPWVDRRVTLWWLRSRLGWTPSVVFAPRLYSTAEAGRYKAQVCVSLGLEKFLESDSRQADVIRENARETLVMLPTRYVVIPSGDDGEKE